MIYQTNQGDRLDAICQRYYGTLQGRVVEQVLAANPGLASLTLFLPFGIEIYFPDIAVQSTAKKRVRLWD